MALAAGACMLYVVFGQGEPGVLPSGGTPESRSLSQRGAGVLVLVMCTLDMCGCVPRVPCASPPTQPTVTAEPSPNPLHSDRVTARLPEYAALITVVGRLFLPAFLGQAIVVFTLLHLFTYLGMCVALTRLVYLHT